MASNESESPPKKRSKVECINKHKYPEIPLSMRRNLELLKVESLNASLSHENLKTLMAHTYMLVEQLYWIHNTLLHKRISCTKMLHLRKEGNLCDNSYL